MEFLYKKVDENTYQVIAELQVRLPPFEGDFLDVQLRDFVPDLSDFGSFVPDAIVQNRIKVRQRELRDGITGHSFRFFEAVSDLGEIDSPDLKMVEDGPYL